MNGISNLKSQISDLLRAHDGPLTRQLLREPGGFGLGQVPAHLKPDATTTSICGYCSTGCGLRIHLKDGQAVGLTPETHYPVNLGMACPKGWEALSVLNADDRATTPLLRGTNGKLAPVDWDPALRTFVERFKTIQANHGLDSIAWLGTGQIVTEELALLGALAKFGMGIIHGDGNTRQCMATAVTAYKQSFGSDAPPYTYQDLEESDVIVLVGSNLCIAHPILWERVCRNPHDPAIIVIDPRKTETAMAATHHLPIRPKSDLSLFYGLANILIHQNWIDRTYIDAHTNGFDEFARHVAAFTPPVVAERTGISESILMRIAGLIHDGQRVSFWWTMGVNQSHEGTRVAQSIINLGLMTGNLGRPGTGANSVTGQCNAMGSRLFSNTTNLLGGHEFTHPGHRRKVADILGIDPAMVPDRNSWAYHEIIEGIGLGKIKGLWVIATNSAHSWINHTHIREVFERLDFLVVQDMYPTTETAQMAHLFLPAAGWGEKEGTFINSERRIGRVKKVKRAPSQALADFAIFKLIAHYWGCAEMFRDWSCPEAVFQILKKLSAGQPCDITGIEDYAMLDACGGVQWPWTESDNLESEISNPQTHRRLFEDGKFYHPDGRAKFIFEDPRPVPEAIDDNYPMTLLTGRGTASQWHTQTRTAKSTVLRKLYPEGVYVEVNPADAAELGIKPGTWAYVESRRGKLRGKVFVTPCVQKGHVFIPMHYPQVNKLTYSAFDPYSKQPAYKACAVRLRRPAYLASEGEP